MSAGPAAGGFAYFAIAKFIGYTAFCRWVIEPRLYENATLPASALSAQPPDSLQPVSAFQAGAARTVIGVLAGALAGLLYFSGIQGTEQWERLGHISLLRAPRSYSNL